MSEQVGIEVWFRASRDGLTERDHAALCWWLHRKIGAPVTRVISMSGTRPDPRDPLSCRTYHGDGTYQWGWHTTGQVRTGGGIKGVVEPSTPIGIDWATGGDWSVFMSPYGTHRSGQPCPSPRTDGCPCSWDASSPTHVSEGTET